MRGAGGISTEARVIEVRDAKKWIQNGTRRVEILKGITLTIPAGQFVAIVGASGSGKSTLLGLLAGLDAPSSGEIWLDGVPIHNLAEAQLAAVRGSKLGFVFQSYQLIQTLTALENVLLPYELNLSGSGLEKARKLLGEVGLGERMDHYPVQLSGGEQQRVALARAFVTEPPIVMADEPTGNLDSTNGRLVLDLLLDRNKRLLQASESLSWVMWVAAVGGGMITVGMSFVLYMDKPRPQVVMTSVLAALIGVLLFIMAVFNHPFQGPLAITPEPFESSIKLFDQIDGDFR